MKKAMKVFITICIIIAALIIVGKSILFPRYDEIETTGPYRIACEDYWVTEDKADPFLKDGSLREVQVRAWYPKDYDNPDVKLPVIIASHLSVLCGLFGGGDMNGIALLLPEWIARFGFGVLLVIHCLLLWIAILPKYRKSFAESSTQ